MLQKISRRWIGILCLSFLPQLLLGQEVDNPGLLNILHIEPSASLVKQGGVENFSLFEDEIKSWIETAILKYDFGNARWGSFRSDSMAFLEVRIEIQPQQGSTYTAVIFTQVLRPGLVLDIPIEDNIFDVPVMSAAFSLTGPEFFLRERFMDLIDQFVRYAAERIAKHNPKME